jgi:hypothetical protein
MSGPRDSVQVLEIDSRSKRQTFVNLDYLRNPLNFHVSGCRFVLVVSFWSSK